MSDDLEAMLTLALEPLVAELETLRGELAKLEARPDTAAPIVVELETVRGLVAELEARPDTTAPIAAELETVRGTLETVRGELETALGELATLRLHRLDAPAWAPGVYRQGAVVQHFLGQYFEATADTAAEPGEGEAWRRLGLHGFRYRGLYIDGAEYEPGDLVARDGAMLMQTGSTLTWLALRGQRGKPGGPGEPGKPGAPGEPGKPGAPGAPGAALVKLEAERGVLFAVMSDGERRPIALEAINGGGA